MSWEPTDDRQYAVDWQVVWRLVESYVRAKLQVDRSTVVSMRQSKWYNPFSWQLPDIRQVEVDWDALGDEVKVTTFLKANGMYSRGAAGGPAMRDVAYELQHLVRQTPHLKDQFVKKMREASRQTMDAINRSVDSYQGTIDGLKVVRDTAATGLLIGATAATGGAAMGLGLAAGGTLKGWGKYQDTGKVGAAVMEGAGAVAFTLIPLGAELTRGQQAWLIVAQGEWDADTSLVEGKSLREALEDGTLSILGSAAGAGVGHFLEGESAKAFLDRVSAPINANIQGVDGAKLIAETLTKVTEGAVRAVPGAVRSALASRAAPTSPRGRSRYLDHSILLSEGLLDLAVVNMSKGVGRGW